MYFLVVYPGALHKESKYIGCRNTVAVQHNLKWARTSEGAVHSLHMVCSEENWPDEAVTLGLMIVCVTPACHLQVYLHLPYHIFYWLKKRL